MESTIGNLKRRSRQIADEARPGTNTSKRIGDLFYDIVCEIESSRWKVIRRTFLLGVVSAVTSIASLILSIFKSDDITVNGANLLGVIVGVLSFIVTLLIGYQIYKTIEIEDVIDKKMNSIEERMHESVKTLVEVEIGKQLSTFRP